jgi:hypothetical protein
MEKKGKKKKSLFRRILKWTGITFLVLIIALILVPIIFKDEIKEMVMVEVNNNLNAKLSLGEFDLTFLSTFPNMTVELNGTKLEGINEFKGVELASIKQFVAYVDFWSVVSGDQVEIDEIHLKEPNFDVRVLNIGLANYDIVKPDSVKTPELAKNFVTVEKLAPIAKYAQGKISSSFDMKTDMTPDLSPIYNSLTGNGDFSTSTVTIKGFKPFEKMGEVLQMSMLSSQTIKDVKAKFSFAMGR